MSTDKTPVAPAAADDNITAPTKTDGEIVPVKPLPLFESGSTGGSFVTIDLNGDSNTVLRGKFESFDFNDKEPYRIQAENWLAKEGKTFGLPIGEGFVDPKTVPDYIPVWEDPVFLKAISWGCKCEKCPTAALEDNTDDILKCWASRSK